MWLRNRVENLGLQRLLEHNASLSNMNLPGPISLPMRQIRTREITELALVQVRQSSLACSNPMRVLQARSWTCGACEYGSPTYDVDRDVGRPAPRQGCGRTSQSTQADPRGGSLLLPGPMPGL